MLADFSNDIYKLNRYLEYYDNTYFSRHLQNQKRSIPKGGRVFLLKLMIRKKMKKMKELRFVIYYLIAHNNFICLFFYVILSNLLNRIKNWLKTPEIHSKYKYYLFRTMCSYEDVALSREMSGKFGCRVSPLFLITFSKIIFLVKLFF